MKASNTTTGLAVGAVLYLFANQGVWAGSTSLLDPYATVEPTIIKVNKHPKAKASKNTVENPAFTNDKEIQPTPVRKTSALNAPSAKESKSRNLVQPEKIAKAKPEKSITVKPAKVASVKASGQPEKANEFDSENPPSKDATKKKKHVEATNLSEEGVGSGLKEIGHGYVKTFKAAGAAFANGTRAVGAKFATGAKVSGGCLAKSGDAFAQGLKSTGGTMKAGVATVGEKVKGSSVENKVKNEEPGEKVKLAKAPKGKKVEIATKADEPLGKPSEASGQDDQFAQFATIGKPLPPLEPLKTHQSKSAVIGKTVGKLNFFSLGKKTKTNGLQIQPARQTAISSTEPLTPN